MIRHATIGLTLACAACAAGAQPHAAHPGAGQETDWRRAEAPMLRHHVQITSRDAFVKAGEAYFSPDASWIVFQAVPVPAEGSDPDPFYSMYVARLTRDAGGRITGIREPILVSPPGSANTCGWFHPLDPSRIVFGSTITPPTASERPGFQVGTRRYVWMFPEEMEVVTRTVPEIRADLGLPPPAVEPEDIERPARVFSRPNYDAECSWSPDGRFLLYANVREEEEPVERPDADLWIYDPQTGEHHPIVTADGYDGGPFFSPDGTMICYRSDRRGDDRLQIFIARLAFNDDGVPVGIESEHQLTDNSHVNWAPYWHPSGRYLVYASSEAGHHNYEVYAVEAALDKEPRDLRTRRITHADGADVLPVFSDDGSLMMWTAQRGPVAEAEGRPSSQIWIAEVVPGGPLDDPAQLFAPAESQVAPGAPAAPANRAR